MANGNSHGLRDATEIKITTVGIDLAKNVIQVHGVDERGKTVLNKQFVNGNRILPRGNSNLPTWLGIGVVGGA